MLKRCGLVGVLSLFLLAHGAAAYGASTAAAPGDPPAGSPSGAIYQLPFEKGRADAAPQGGGGTSAPGESGLGGDGANGNGAEEVGDTGAGGEEEAAGGEASFYRSENNFGSSSRVPGQPSGAGAAGSDASGGATDGTGSTSASTAAGSTRVTDSGSTSLAGSIALLCAIGLIAGGVGAFALHANRLKAR